MTGSGQILGRIVHVGRRAHATFQPLRAVGTAAGTPFATLSWEAHDRYRWITVLALVGLVIAAAMAAFGLPPIDVHSPLHRLGVMDPLCGGTRAARYVAQGWLADAWRYNPLGVLALVGAVVALSRAFLGLTIGRWATLTIAWTPGRCRLVIWFALVLITALEVRQQLRADLLISGS